MLTSKNLKDVCVAAELWQEYEKNLSSINAKNFNFNLILEKNKYIRKVKNHP